MHVNDMVYRWYKSIILLFYIVFIGNAVLVLFIGEFYVLEQASLEEVSKLPELRLRI